MNDRFFQLKAGLYGTGAFGRFIIEALAQSEVIRVSALASRTPQRASAAAAQHGISRVHQTFEQLITDPDLDVIILATPPAEHGPQTLAALGADKHVFVEKPMATTLEFAERVIDAASARTLVVAVDYPMLYTPLVEAVTLFAKSQLVGPLLRISVESIASSQGLDDSHWFWNKEISGGIFVEHGVHFFDWCGRIAGDAQRVVALTCSSGPLGPLARDASKVREDRVFAAVEHVQGAIASYYHAFVTQPQMERTRSVLSFESVDLILDGWIPNLLRLHGQGAAVGTTTIRRMMGRSVASVPDASAGFIFDAGPKQVLYASAVRAAIEDMARSIREPGYIARDDVRRALPSLQVAVAAREAARIGRSVNLTSAKISALP